MKEQIRLLKKLKPCSDAIVFVEKYKKPQGAWDACERGDWMLWFLGKLAGSPRSKSRKKLVLTACKCARLSLKHIPKKEKRPLRAIQIAENWAKGKGKKLKDVRAADAAAAAAADAAYAAAAADDDDAAADAVYAAAAAVYAAAAADAVYAAAAAVYAAAADAAYAAAAATYVAYADADDDAVYAADAADATRKDVLEECANIVRRNYPIVPKLKD